MVGGMGFCPREMFGWVIPAETSCAKDWCCTLTQTESNCGLPSYACGARLQDEGQHRTAVEGVCNAVRLIPLKRLHESLFQKSRN